MKNENEKAEINESMKKHFFFVKKIKSIKPGFW